MPSAPSFGRPLLPRLLQAFILVAAFVVGSGQKAVRDREAPSVPSNLAASAISAGGFTVSWSPSTDNVGVTGYEVFLNGATQGTQATTSRTFSGLQAGTVYSVTVRARDAAANWSAQSSPLSVPTVADTEPPSVPTNVTISNVGSSHYTVTWSPATDNVGVVRYNIHNGVWGAWVEQPPLSFVNVAPYTTHSLVVQAQDAAGNLSPWSEPVEVTVGPPAGGPFSIAAGERWAVMTRGDDSFWIWGSDSGPTPIFQGPNYGQVGAKAASVGDDHYLLLGTGGTVTAGGSNDFGQIADGTLTKPIGGLPANMTAVAAGGFHSLALSSTQEIYAWGGNFAGQVGNGRTTNVTSPTKLSKITGIRRIAAGKLHSLALKNDGTVLAWGSNSHGQVGNGGSTDQRSPLLVSGLTGVTEIVAAGNFSVALKADGTVWTWGDNTFGQLGIGHRTLQRRPIQVPNLDGVVAITAGNSHVLALKTDGTIWAWGGNALRQLGDGTDVDRLEPTRVTVLSHASRVAAGGQNSYAVDLDGALRSWGDPQKGLLGDGGGPKWTVPFTDLLQLTRANWNTSIALRRDGTVWWWGGNNDALMTGGEARPGVFPTRVPGLSGATQIAWAPVALRRDGTVWTWGKNDQGQLGDGSSTDRAAAEAVAGLQDVVQVAGGRAHRLALKADGTVWAWGANQYGQIGDGSTNQRNAPVQVPGLFDIVWIEAAGDNSFAVSSTGASWSWGYDWWASGTGTGASSSVPVRTLVNNVAKISSNGRQTIFLTRSGTAYICGYSNLGVGQWWGHTVPQLIPNMNGLVEVTTRSGARSRASDGRLWAWELDSAASYIQPVTDVPEPTSLRSIESGYLYQDGRVLHPRVGPVHAVGFETVASRVAGVRVNASPLDTDGNGLPDEWELVHFGRIRQSPSADPDGDGLSNLQEYSRGTHPLAADLDGDNVTDMGDLYPEDYYNNAPPLLVILGGDEQQAFAGQFNRDPLDVAVWSPEGDVPLIDAPVDFSVLSGGGALAPSTDGSTPEHPAHVLLTDEEGTARAFYRQPSTAGVVSTIRVTAGLSQVQFTTTSTSPGADSDGNGLPDPWELHYFGALGVDPHGDADGDGISNLQEYLNGTSPIDYYNGVLPQISSLLIDGTPGADGVVSVHVTRIAGGAPLINAPVTFSVISGANEISATPGGSPSVLVTVRTDAQGIAKVHLHAPVVGVQRVSAEAVSAGQHVSLTLRLKPAAVTDADGNGLPDWWEIKHFGATGVDPAADPDGDGASNRLEFERGTHPGVADLPPGDSASLRLFTPLSR